MFCFFVRWMKVTSAAEGFKAIIAEIYVCGFVLGMSS